MYPQIEGKQFELNTIAKLREYILDTKEAIPFGNGRSYGDSALNTSMINCKNHNSFLDFDEDNGILHVESGVLLSEILKKIVPKGWFLKITPGTKFITIGGAIASDVHGKNHHKKGCFSECVEEFDLMIPNGSIVSCKKTDELFKATCGGMGLTGVIINAKISLEKIKSKNIDQITIKTKNLKETFQAFEDYSSYPYSVAWIDCLAEGEEIGRCLLKVGSFSNDKDLKYKQGKKINIPAIFPSFLLNKLSIKIFNWIYYHKIYKKESKQKVDIDKFFYPLDNLNNWNRIYGKQGFTQYQFILPKRDSYDGLFEILSKISDSGQSSFLSVLKLYGKENKNYLSFPMEGYSLALDFKINRKVFKLLDELDKLVLKYNGRVYLAKDVRISKNNFEKNYPNIGKFRKIRKEYSMDKKFQSLQSKRIGI
ncbi:MAG: FAD-binding oxidoreductase [Pseudomonadota bacterium]|nr:FAD-binding oxidoreductase [Pseudomonadota bacterium]